MISSKPLRTVLLFLLTVLVAGCNTEDKVHTAYGVLIRESIDLSEKILSDYESDMDVSQVNEKYQEQLQNLNDRIEKLPVLEYGIVLELFNKYGGDSFDKVEKRTQMMTINASSNQRSKMKRGLVLLPAWQLFHGPS